MYSQSALCYHCYHILFYFLQFSLTLDQSKSTLLHLLCIWDDKTFNNISNHLDHRYNFMIPRLWYPYLFPCFLSTPLIIIIFKRGHWCPLNFCLLLVMYECMNSDTATWMSHCLSLSNRCASVVMWVCVDIWGVFFSCLLEPDLFCPKGSKMGLLTLRCHANTCTYISQDALKTHW